MHMKTTCLVYRHDHATIITSILQEQGLGQWPHSDCLLQFTSHLINIPVYPWIFSHLQGRTDTKLISFSFFFERNELLYSHRDTIEHLHSLIHRLVCLIQIVH